MSTARQLNVLYLIDGLDAAGAERSLLALARPYAELDIGLEIAYFKDRSMLRAEFEARSTPVFPLLGGAGVAGRVARARRLIHERRPDLVHTTLVHSDVAGRIAATAAQVPVVSSLVTVLYGKEHLTTPELRPWKVRAVQAMDVSTAQLAVRFHALTEHVAEVMARRLLVSRDLIDVVPRCRDSEEIGVRTPARRASAREMLQLLPSDTLILAAARQEWQKGLDVLVEAMPYVLAQLPSARLVIAGREGNETLRLRALVNRHRLGETVRFLGFRSDVPELLTAADVFVVPSRWEGLGSVLIEAMALQAPIVASDLPPIREVVGSSEAGFAPPDRPEALAAAVVAALANAEETTARAARARARYLQRFTPETVARGMHAFYERAMMSGKTVRARGRSRCRSGD